MSFILSGVGSMNLFKQRKWGKPQRNLAFIRSSSVPYFWGEENYFLSDFFLPGDPPDQFNIAADSSGESQREHALGWWGFAGTFLGFTSWRLFSANPQVRMEQTLESRPYSEIDIQFHIRSDSLTMDIIDKTKFIGERYGCNSLLVTTKQRHQIESLIRGEQPKGNFSTTMEWFTEPWGLRAENPGQELIAKMAQERSGDVEAGMVRCTSCRWETTERFFRDGYQKLGRCPGCLRTFRTSG